MRSIPQALIAGLVVSMLAVAPALAQRYPSKPVTIVVPFPAGGTTDVFARAIGRRMAEDMGQSAIIENRSGAGGIVGAIAAKNAAPDGHTLFVGHKGTHSLYVLMTDKPEYDPVKDFRGISTFMVNSSILVVPSSLPVKDLPGLLAIAKSRPGGLNFASQGPGTSGHFLGEMFRVATGLPMVHIPMKGGGPAVTETVAGRTDMLFAAWSAAGEYIRDGRLRPLAVTSNTRSHTLPQVPTLQELGIRNVEFDTWFAFFAPARTPDPIIARLNGEVAKAMANQEVVELLAKHDIKPKTSTPEELTRLVIDETARYADVVKRIGAKVN